MPLVDSQRQRAAHPHVIERLLLMVRRDHVAAVPVALLQHDLVAESALKLLARGGRQAAELAGRAVGENGIDAYRLFGREDADEAVEIRLSRMIIVGIAHALDRLAGLIADELEWAGAHDIHLVPARILVENGLLINERIRL